MMARADQSKAKPQPIGALLFDLGGVLIEIDFERVFSAWAKFSSLPLAEIRRRFSVDIAYEHHERGELDGPSYLRHIKQLLEIDAPSQALHDAWNAIFIGRIESTIAQVEAARQHQPCFVFTNSNELHQQTWQAAYPDLLSLFEEVFVSSELGLRKPEPKAFAAVASRIGLAAPAILFFDDLRQNIEGARAFGMQAIRVRNPSDVQEALEHIQPN